MFLNWGFRNFIEWYLKDDMAGLLQSLRKPICAASRQSVLDRAIADFEIEKQNWNGEDLTIRINGIKQIPSRGIYDDRIVIPR